MPFGDHFQGVVFIVSHVGELWHFHPSSSPPPAAAARATEAGLIDNSRHARLSLRERRAASVMSRSVITLPLLYQPGLFLRVSNCGRGVSSSPTGNTGSAAVV